MIYQIDLLTLLLAPVMAYLAAALIFSVLDKDADEPTLSTNATNLHYRNGQQL